MLESSNAAVFNHESDQQQMDVTGRSMQREVKAFLTDDMALEANSHDFPELFLDSDYEDTGDVKNGLLELEMLYVAAENR